MRDDYDETGPGLVKKVEEPSLAEALEIELQKILKEFTNLENRIDELEDQVGNLDIDDLDQRVETVENELEDLKDNLRNV